MIEYRARCMLLSIKLKRDQAAFVGMLDWRAGKEGVKESRECQKDLQFLKKQDSPTTAQQTERMFQKQASKPLSLIFLLEICFLPYCLEKTNSFFKFKFYH